MSHPRIELPPHGAPLPPLPDRGWVVWVARSPLCPGLADAISATRAAGLRAKVEVPPRDLSGQTLTGAPEAFTALRDAGAEVLQLWIHDEVDLQRAQELPTQGWKLELWTAAPPPSLLQVAQRAQAAAHVRPTAPLAEPDLAQLDALMTEADAVGVSLTLHARGPWTSLRPTTPSPLGPSRWRALLDAVPLPSLRAGVTGAPSDAGAADPEQVRHALAALHCPLHGDAPWGDLPAWRAHPGRLQIVNPAIGDTLLTLSTLPALTRALRERGADVRYADAWGHEDPSTGTIHLHTSGPTRRGQLALAQAREAQMWASLDLSDRDTILVPGYPAAAAVLAHPTLRPDARVVVFDLHLLHGVEALTAGGWPSERVTVHSCFPGYAHLYLRRAVPLRQVLWRPYPVDLRTMAPGGSTGSCRDVFAGGNQRRDWKTLAAAAEHLDPSRAHVDVWTRDAAPPGLPPALRPQGTVDLPAFFEAIRARRFAVVPVGWDPDGASGLTVVALALAAGRPVIGTLVPGMIDHLRHGEDAILVPTGDARALGRAMAKLVDDGPLLARLEEGARAAGRRLSVDAWAVEILEGPLRARTTGAGPFRSW